MTYDYNKTIKIKQSEEKKYIIKKSEKWSGAIDLLIDIEESIDYVDLYIIVKSYLLCVKYPFPEFAVRILNEHDAIVTQRMNAQVFSKMSFFEFVNWAQYRIAYDLQYCQKNSLYSFSFMCNRKIVSEEDLDFLKPIYPWKEEVLIEIKKIENKEQIFSKIIESKNKEIERLKKRIKDIEKGTHTNDE